MTKKQKTSVSPALSAPLPSPIATQLTHTSDSQGRCVPLHAKGRWTFGWSTLLGIRWKA